MKRTTLFIIAFVITLIGFAQSNNPVTWEINSVKVDAGIYDLKIKAKIKAPWHIYSQNASTVGLGMPTQINFEENASIEFMGSISEKGIESKEVSSHYSKEVTFTQRLKLKTLKGVELHFSINYMVCTNAMCLPPKTEAFSVSFNENAIAY